MNPTNALIFLLFLSIVVGTATAILAWREHPKPGTLPLVALLVGQNWWSIAIVFRLQADGLSTKLLWNNLAWIGVALIPVAWLLFSLEYAGRDHIIGRNLLWLLGIVPFVTLVLVLIWPFQDWLIVKEAVVGSNGILRIEYGGPWYAVISGYTYLLGVIGIIVLIGLIQSRLLAFRRQAITLLIGMSFPYLTNLLYLFDVIPQVGIDPTPIGFAVSGVAFLLAIKRYKLLDTSPAANRQARELVFDRMQEGVVVVDANDHVVDINRPAEEFFGGGRASVLGNDAGDLIPEYNQIPPEGALEETVTLRTEDGVNHLQVESIPIRSSQDAIIGRVISIYDVSEFVRRQQRLEVLNRILRHNIRSETNLILGHAERMTGDASDLVQEHAVEIDQIGQKSRTAIDLFERANTNPAPVPLETIVEGALADAPVESFDAAVSVSMPEGQILVSNIVEPAIRNAVDNAVVHGNSPTVEVLVRKKDGTATVTIRDDGPGISDYELDVLRAGTETDLEHTSGLGLWIIKWGVDLAGGTVSFETGDTGTTVRIEVPVVEETPGREAAE